MPAPLLVAAVADASRRAVNTACRQGAFGVAVFPAFGIGLSERLVFSGPICQGVVETSGFDRPAPSHGGAD